MGFLLRSLNITVALTSEMCHKTLPKEQTGEIGNIKGWPKLMWYIADTFSSKPPKEWHPPADIPDHAPAYIEVSGCATLPGVFSIYLSHTVYCVLSLPFCSTLMVEMEV